MCVCISRERGLQARAHQGGHHSQSNPTASRALESAATAFASAAKTAAHHASPAAGAAQLQQTTCALSSPGPAAPAVVAAGAEVATAGAPAARGADVVPVGADVAVGTLARLAHKFAARLGEGASSASAPLRFIGEAAPMRATAVASASAAAAAANAGAAGPSLLNRTRRVLPVVRFTCEDEVRGRKTTQPLRVRARAWVYWATLFCTVRCSHITLLCTVRCSRISVCVMPA